MKEQLISFETAKLAKENGFDEIKGGVYYTNLGMISFCQEGSIMAKDCLNRNLGHCFVTTQSLLQKWLREKHKLVCEVGYDFVDDEPNKWNECVIEAKKDGKYYATEAIHVSSYEQALEIALKTALELL